MEPGLLKHRPIKTQIRWTIMLIIVSALLATIATYVLGVLLFTRIQYKSVYPANYYEQQLPGIEAYIRQEGSRLLQPEAKEHLEQVIPLEGIDYQVLDERGRVLYGTILENMAGTPQQLYERLNLTLPEQGRFVKAVPIVAEHGLAGAVLLAYQLKVTSAGEMGRLYIVLLFAAMVFSPFLYALLFIWIYSKQFANRINRPLNMLMHAANQIKAKNLDFELDYRADNEIGRLCAAFSDMQHELKRSLIAQWRMEEERKAMVESLAHDLKTPLATILAYTEALMDAKDASRDKSERYLAVIRANAEKGTALVKQMKYAAELEKAVPALQEEPVAIGSFLEEKIRQYGLQAGRQGIRIITDLRGEMGQTARIDTEKLGRILDNIVTNALEHTPRGGCIRFRAQVKRGRAEYEICNSGSRFSARDLEQGFQKFYRGEEARSSKGGHAGLGLYIVKQLAEQMGGSAALFNSEAGEACVRFSHSMDSQSGTEGSAHVSGGSG